MLRTRRHLPAGPLWLFALALLLRAAMPFLAAVPAKVQGPAFGEICSVHGAAPSGARHDVPIDPAAGHASEHCTLCALAVLAAPVAPPRLGVPLLAAQAAAPRAGSPAVRADATAAWIARRKQGPPGLA